MTFAIITPALIVGAFAERMKFSAVALFIPLWVTFVYFPIAHMVWYWAGPTRSTPLPSAGGAGRLPRRPRRQARRSLADAAGVHMGRIDFAGGTVVHINAGIAGLVVRDHARQAHRLRQGPDASALAALTMIGASLLWVGWFGFNAGSDLDRRRQARHGHDLTHSSPPRPRRCHLDVRRMDRSRVSPRLGIVLRLRRRSGRRHSGLRLRRPDGRDRARPRRRRGLLLCVTGLKNACSATTTRSTCSACTASAASSARSRTGILVDPALGGTGIWTTRPARSPTTT